MKSCSAVVAVALTSFFSGAIAQQPVTQIPMYPNAISGDGLVVVGFNSANQAVYWTRSSSVVSLGVPAGFTAGTALAVSEDGSTIAGRADVVGGPSAAWVWTQATGMNLITVPGRVNASARSITPDGRVVAGTAVDPSTNFAHVFLWSAQDGVHELPQGSNLNATAYGLTADGQQAVGSASGQPVIWASIDQSCTALGSSGTARAITPAGDLVVGELQSGAFVWSPSAGVTQMPPLSGATYARLQAVSSNGQFAAGYMIFNQANPIYGAWPLLWRPGAGLIRGTDYFAAHGVTNLPPDLYGIAGMSSNGRVFAFNHITYTGGAVHGYVIDLGACGSADFDHNADSGTDADIEAFFSCLAGNCCPLCDSADFNGDGDAGTDADIEAFFRVLAGEAC